MNRHRLTLAAAAVVVSLGLMSWDGARASVADTLPERLTGEQYWQLIASLSEPNGAFRSDNLVSNEIYFQSVLPDLVSRVAPGTVYLGVGPEQNFTYIAALRPKMAFITDIRRGNLHTHLMYKALFELSSDRADFISRLFTKPRPDGLTAESTAAEIMNAYWDEAVLTGGPDAFEKNAKAMLDRLTVTHGLPLSDADRQLLLVRPDHHLQFVDEQPGQLRQFPRPDGRHRRRRPGAELSGQRGRLPVSAVPAPAQPARAGRGRLRRAEGAPVRRAVRSRSRRDDRRLLPVERRAVPEPGRHLALFLRERRVAAPRRAEHVHPVVVAGARRLRAGPRARQLARADARRDARLRGAGQVAAVGVRTA
jgi:hypothetical protein